MYDILLSKTWDDMMESEYMFKSNTEKHVIDIRGDEFVDGDKSLIVVFYNLLKGIPMVILQRYPYAGVTIDADKYKDFTVRIQEGKDESGPYTEIAFVLKSIVEALAD